MFLYIYHFKKFKIPFSNYSLILIDMEKEKLTMITYRKI